MNIFTFQDPASEFAQALIQLHHYIFFILIVIFGVVTWLLARILYTFSFKSTTLVEDISVLNNSKYYSVPNSIFSTLFYKTGIVSILLSLDSYLKSLISSIYKFFQLSGKLSLIKDVFANNGLPVNDHFLQKALLNFSNKFYSALNVSKIIYLDNLTFLNYVSSVNAGLFSGLFDKFLINISWDSSILVSSEKLNNIFNSNFSLEDLVSEDLSILLNNTNLNSKYSVNGGIDGFGAVTNLVFNQYYQSLYRNPELIDDSKPYYYSFSNFYKFYNVDIYKTSFLFFENVRHSTKLEIVWTIVPTLVLVLIAMPSFALLYSYDEPLSSPSVTIKAVGHQWYWSYEYTDYATGSISFDSYMVDEAELNLGELRLLETDNRIVLPVGVAVRVLITSGDVLHSWAVPSFAVKADAVPGRLNQVILLITRPGVFYGQCSELCGVNHGFMPIVVEAVTIENFFSWVSSNLS